MIEIDNGFNRYYWEGSFSEQPIWFVTMLRTAQNVWNTIRKEKAKK